MSRRSIEEVQKTHTPSLLAINGVVGTYLGETDGGEPCIKVMVRQLTPDLKTLIPEELEGYPVEIVESGTIRPLPDQGAP